MELVIVKLSMLVICYNLFMPYVLKLFNLKVDLAKVFCGMVGFCGDKPADASLLKLMLIFNQERGEDSTGWAINNEIVKDTESVKKFLTKNNIEFSATDENFTFIAHARKASSGGKFVKELAHPFGVYKDGVEKDRFDLILAMNGTLTNTAEIAKEYDVKYTAASNSDTQILSRIMAKLGEKEYIKALETYDGAATLLFFTPKFANTLMVFKDPERPLFYWQRAKNEMYISSMEEPLYAIGAKLEDVNSFEDNILYRITKGRITKQVKITRTPLKKKIVSNYNRNDYYDGYGENFSWQNRSKGKRNGGASGCTANFPNHGPSNPGNSMARLDILKSSISSASQKLNGGIYCLIDRYYRNGHPLNEIADLNEEGLKVDKLKALEKTERYHFINGYMIKDAVAYNTLMNKFVDSKNDFSLIEFKKLRLSELCDFFAYPVITIVDKEQKYLLNQEWSKKVENRGDIYNFTMPFSDLSITLKWDGRCIEQPNDDPKIMRVCDIVSVLQINDQNVVDDAPNDTTINDASITVDFKRELDRILRINPQISTSALYTRFAIEVWKKNNTERLKYLFFNKFVRTLLTETVISEENSKDIIACGEKCKYDPSNKEFDREIQFCIQIYRKHIRRESELKKVFSLPGVDSIVDEHVGKENLNDEESILDKQIRAEQKETEDLIQGIKASNRLFADPQFKQDFYDLSYDDLKSFSKDYISSQSIADGEVRIFCEAILLCLESIGKISAGRLLELVEKHDYTLEQESETEYKGYYNSVKTEDAIIVEEYGETEHEEEAVNNFLDLMGTLADHIKTMSDVKEEQRTPKFNEVLNFFIATYGSMKQESTKVNEDDK